MLKKNKSFPALRMKFSILTLFPDMFTGPFNISILKRAQENNYIEIQYINIRDFGIGKQKSVDDTPYGGGAGMVLRVDVLDKAIVKARCQNTSCQERVLLLDPQGTVFTQQVAQELTAVDHLILVCGHYEGFDERIRSLVNCSLSIGDYVLTGGELPTMVVVDAVARLIPGVLGKDASSKAESFQTDSKTTTPMLEYPHYTKPLEYKGEQVPDILLSGNHAKIEAWRKMQAKINTQKRRPDLLK